MPWMRRTSRRGREAGPRSSGQFTLPWPHVASHLWAENVDAATAGVPFAVSER